MMLFIVLCGMVLVGSLLGSAVDMALECYKAHRDAEDVNLVRGMMDGSEPFIAERYLRIHSELTGGRQFA